MKFPKWIPYPKAWKQTLMLILDLIPISAFYFLFGDYLRVMVEKVGDHSLKTDQEVYFWSLIGILFLFQVWGISLTHQLLFDSRAKSFHVWFPRWRCWKEGLIGMLFLGVASGVAFLFEAFSIEAKNLDYAGSAAYYSIPLILVLAYLYHVRNLVFKGYGGAKKAKNSD